MRRTGYCLYGHHDADDLTVEHVLAADIGATLKIAACRRCNHRVATLVDRPLGDFPDVAALCALYDVRNERRRSRRRRFELVGELDDGSRALYRPHADPDLRQVTTSSPAVQADGSFVYALPADDPERLRRALHRDLERQHPGKTVTVDREVAAHKLVTFTGGRSVRACLWPRLCAKVALGLADGLLDPEWRDSYTARQLRSILLLGRSLEGVRAHELPLTVAPDQLDEQSVFFQTLTPWEHMVILDADGSALAVRGVLFGELAFSARFACDLTWASGPQAWLVDARAFTSQRMSLPDLAQWLTIRSAQFGFASELHKDRPRGRVLDDTPVTAVSASLATG